MGDRGNIKVVSSETPEGIYFYSHWGGEELPETLRKALKNGVSRWGDEPYLNRIIFCTMINGDTDGLTGFGISTYETDNGHPIITVDHSKEVVSFNGASWSFKEYINASAGALKEAFEG